MWPAAVALLVLLLLFALAPAPAPAPALYMCENIPSLRANGRSRRLSALLCTFGGRARGTAAGRGCSFADEEARSVQRSTITLDDAAAAMVAVRRAVCCVRAAAAAA